MERDLLKELYCLGLSENQAKIVLDWTEKLPIHIEWDVNNTTVFIKEGIVTVKPTSE